jgi:hypothetical protein
MANILAGVAAYEAEVGAERILAGPTAARDRGVRWGGSVRRRRIGVTVEQIAPIPRLRSEGQEIAAIARAMGLGSRNQSSEQKRTVSPSSAPGSNGTGSPRPGDSDGSRVLEPTCFSATTPGIESGIPAITLVLTGTAGEPSGGRIGPSCSS